MGNSPGQLAARRARPVDADVVARLLHDFNTEYDSPTPGPGVLSERLRFLLAEPTTIAYLVDEPAAGVALVTTRRNVWYDAPVALLDELYVVPDRRGQGLGAAIVRRLIEEVSSFRSPSDW